MALRRFVEVAQPVDTSTVAAGGALRATVAWLGALWGASLAAAAPEHAEPKRCCVIRFTPGLAIGVGVTVISDRSAVDRGDHLDGLRSGTVSGGSPRTA